MKLIKVGDENRDVKIAQVALGFSHTDGLFSADFKAFVREFQKNNGLTADGIIGALTWDKIREKASTIRFGAQGSWVKVWQLFLGNLTTDGIFGKNTLRATKTFQGANNLTMDGIVGKNTWGKAFGKQENESTPLSGTNTKKPVDYKQYDKRWGSIRYTANNTYNPKQTIKNSGCGPTAMANVVATFWDKNVTPDKLASWSVANGYRTLNSGTSWGFYKAIAQKYKSSKFIQTTSYATAKSALKNGALIVVSVGPSIFTKKGHFITWWKSEGGYNYVNDPASNSSSRAKNLEKHIQNAAKQYFIFYK